MFIIENYLTAVLFCVITMLCWGSWANTQKLASKEWRFELFYWDYTIGILFLATLFALTIGSIGNQGRSFMNDISQADTANIKSALIGGGVFNLANILLIAAISIAGMSVAFPVGIGIALILGVVDNYSKDPVGNALVLFSGVGLIAVAIILNALAYRRMTSHTKNVSTKGLLLSVISGILMGKFYGFVAVSMTKDFANPELGKLTPYTVVFFFALGIFLSNFILNTILMKKPFQGSSLSFADYFKGNFRSHLMGILGGVIWCVGMSFNIIASGKAGPAISYGLGQGATVVAAVWGIFIWKEFKQAPEGTNIFINAMLVFYVIGISLIVSSRFL